MSDTNEPASTAQGARVAPASITICGLGLIGSSVARGLRAAGWAPIYGIDRDRQALERGQALGVIDRALPDLSTAVLQSDVTLVSVPSLAIAPVIGVLAGADAAVQQRLADGTHVVTDSGSVKVPVLAALNQQFGSAPGWFVPGHPVAGSEASGVDAGRGDLFAGHRVVLTPVATTCRGATARVTALWRALGASVETLTPQVHDRWLARTSHLPHLVAYALVDALGARDDADAMFRFAAGGFRDFTRVASSDPVMWRDIVAGNAAEIVAAMDEALAALQQARDQLQDGELTALETMFRRAKAARDAHIVGPERGPGPAGRGPDADDDDAEF